MHLNEFAIGVVASLLVERRLGRPGADNRVCTLSENRANAAGGHDDGVGWKRAHFHRTQIHSTDAAAGALRINYGGEKFPGFVFRYFAFGFVTPHLFIKGIKKLLAGGDRKSTRLNSSHRTISYA